MSQSREVTTRGVVIGRAQAGEGSVRIFLYTEEKGLVGALAKSAREERSKLRPHLQIGSYGSYTLVKGSYDWRLVGAVDTNNSYFLLSEKKEAQEASARVLSVLRQLIQGEDMNTNLFQTLWNFLSVLATLSPEEIYIAERLAMVRILSSLGYVPTLRNIPHLEGDTFEVASLQELGPFKKELVKTINDAVLASGLS